MTARIALASLAITLAAMAYPWSSTADRVVLGVAVAVVLVVFARWQGSFVTTLVGRRLSMWRRRSRSAGAHQSSLYTTVLMQIDGSGQLPMRVIASYLDRFGVRCDNIRITSRDLDGVRTRWIGLTLGAADNLTALSARSPRIPLRATAEVVGRRLAARLRESGWHVTLVDAADGPVRPDAKEAWRGVRDASGYVAAYRIARLEEVSSVPSSEIWTALEITGSATDFHITSVCAIRSQDTPVSVAGARPLNGRHRPVLDALSPTSVQRIDELIGT